MSELRMAGALRARIGWWLIALVGLAFAVGPVFTHAGLSTRHIIAHLITGPAMIGLSFLQLHQLRTGRGAGYRAIDAILAIFGLWLIALPYAIPAEGLHIHGHAAGGLATLAAAVWNGVSPPRLDGEAT